MSTENNTPVEPQEDDLDLFSAELFGQSEATPEPASSEEEDEVTPEESDASNEDTHVSEDDTLAPEDEDTSEAEETDETPSDSDEQKAQPKKKNRLQERIDQLVRDREEERRERLALQARLDEIINKNTEKTDPTPEVKSDTPGAPQPTDLNEDGEEKYPLGEFDPAYIRDLMKHTLQEERKALEEASIREAEQRKRDEAQAELQASWNEKLVPAKERYPDFQEKGERLLETFQGIDEAYGGYLTDTIMQMEFGPDVFYYLANNVDEAQKIVNSGARQATIALGRLEAKFAAANEEKQQARPRVSNAPPPPTHLNKGSSAALPDVPDDTDDLDAFAAKLFKRRKD